MFDDFVGDDEILYRRIAANRNLYKIGANGTIEISSSAFSDREFKVSVDRGKLCNYNPRYTLGTEIGVVAVLVTGEIRSIDDLTRNDKNGYVIQQFKIDVESAPLANNPAHAQIHAIPNFIDADRKGAFHRLCRRLARLAETGSWKLYPEET